MKIDQKRGQITLFVILAVVVLIVVGFFFYINYQQKTTIISPGRTTVSEQFEPVQIFIEDCMESVARDAIVKLGKHGGYIDPNDAYLSGRLFYANINDQSKSDLAYLSKDPDNAIAYWYYSYDYGGCTDCSIMSQAPYVGEIERQLSVYVSENIDSCLGNFQRFRDQGYAIEIENMMVVKTTMRDEDVFIESHYIIDLTYDNSKGTIENYEATVNIPLLKYYDLAMNITKQEYDRQFLENLNTYLILSYSGLSPDLLPPIYSYSSGYNMLYWTKQSVEQNIKQLLMSYAPLMQVKGTKNYHEITATLTPMEKTFIDLITLDMFPDKNLQKTDISFIYSGQDISVDINPSNNELLGPFKDTADGVSMAPPKNTFTYQFFYDVSYPVIVEIKDEYAPGQYYTFVFALESTIKENLPIREWWNATNRPLYIENNFFDVEYNDPLRDEDIVDQRTGTKHAYKERVNGNSFCEPEQRLSGNVYLKSYDATTKQPLADVDVTFGCGNYASCPVGRTEHDSILDVEAFDGKLPICMNGYVQLEKLGYEKKIVKLSTTSSKTYLGSLYLEPIKKINVTVRIYPMTRRIVYGHSVNLLFPNQSYPLGANDTILINLDRIPSGLEESTSQTVFISPTTNNTEIDLIPGRYTVSGQLFVAEGYVVPKECKSICDNYVLGVCTSHKLIPENNIPVPNAIMGGIDIDSTYPLNVKREYLSGNKTLEIYLIRMPPPPCIDEMQEMGSTSAIVSRYRSRVMPQFK